LIVACGSNDVARWGGRESPPSLSLAFRMETWSKLIEEAKRIFDLIYVCQVLPVDESKVPARKNEQGLDQFYRNDAINEYNSALKNLCSDHACRFVDFTAMLEANDWKACLFDDVHPNAEGHELISRRMFKELEAALLS